MPPQGGILHRASHSKGIGTVSSHAPARGHHDFGKICVFKEKFQVMPPQGGILTPAPATADRERSVSSHAPARGHHVAVGVNCPSNVSFKSCPRKGASSVYPGCAPDIGCFKSCPRKGASIPVSASKAVGVMFQVMPPQGGIFPCFAIKNEHHSFQVMPPQGGISAISAARCNQDGFQVMPPQGGIFRLIIYPYKFIGFKSCPRKGASNVATLDCNGLHVSSHAPARGHLQIYTKTDGTLLYKSQIFF